MPKKPSRIALFWRTLPGAAREVVCATDLHPDRLQELRYRANHKLIREYVDVAVVKRLEREVKHLQKRIAAYKGVETKRRKAKVLAVGKEKKEC